MQHHCKSNRCPYRAATAVETGHLLCQFVQLQGPNAQDLDPEMVWVLVGGDVHLQMFIGLEAQVRTWNWTAHTDRVNTTFIGCDYAED